MGNMTLITATLESAQFFAIGETPQNAQQALVDQWATHCDKNPSSNRRAAWAALESGDAQIVPLAINRCTIYGHDAPDGEGVEVYQGVDVDTSICIFDEFTQRILAESKGNTDSFTQWIVEYNSGYGQAELRTLAINLSKPINAAYKGVEKDYHECFDWEFVPAVLDVAFNTYAAFPELTAEQWASVAKAVVDSQPEPPTPVNA